jgi:predicted dehydrogenase
MMADRISIGFLGVQHYHANFWVKAVLSSPNADVAGVWDNDPSRASNFASTYDIDSLDDLDALLSRCAAVAICSGTLEHVPLIEAAARAGHAILCEKPLAVSTEDTARALGVLSDTKVPFMQSFPKRLDPATLAVREVVDSGDLGQITMIRIRHGHSHGLNPEFCDQWYTDPAQSGGGTLLDEGIHAADFLRQIFGEPSRVSATVSNNALGLRVEDTALAVFAYDNGPIAEVATGWCFAAADASIEVYGTQGTLILSGVDIASRPTRDSDFLRVFRGKEGEKAWETVELIPHFKTGVFHEHVAWAFIDCLKTGAPFPTTARDGARAFSMIAAAYTSAESGQSETIEYLEG